MRHLKKMSYYSLIFFIGISIIMQANSTLAYSISDGSIYHSDSTIAQLPGYPSSVFMYVSNFFGVEPGIIAPDFGIFGFKQEYSLWGGAIKEGALLQFSATPVAAVNMLIVTFLLKSTLSGSLLSYYESTGDVFFFNTGSYTAEIIFEVECGGTTITSKLVGTGLRGKTKTPIANFAPTNCMTRKYTEYTIEYLEVAIPFSGSVSDVNVRIKPIAHSAAAQYKGYLECFLTATIDIVGISGFPA